MPIRAWFSRFVLCNGGVATVELALCMPMLFAIAVILFEGGRALTYGAAIERGLWAGGLYLARAPLPVNATTTAAVQNLVMRGDVNGAAPFLIPGWDRPGAAVIIDRLADYVTNGVAVPVFRVTATVPFTPILPYAPAFTMRLTHEQAYIDR